MFFTAVLSLCLATLIEAGVNDPLDLSREAKARLYDDLAKNRVLQNKLTPLAPGNGVNMTFGVSLTQVTGVIESEQTINTNLYYDIAWVDTALTWNPRDYGDLSHIVVPSASMWYPLVLALNAQMENIFLLETPRNLVLFYNGTVRMILITALTTYCNFELTFYPFDTQNCTITIVPYGEDVVLHTQPYIIDVVELTEGVEILNGEWSRLNTAFNVFISSTGIQCISLSVLIKRAPLYYVLCVILPLVVTSLLTLVVFWIPPDSGEKMSFLVSIYMSTSLFLSLIGSTLPRNLKKSEQIPRMMLFIVFVTLECVLCIIATAYVMRRHVMEERLPTGAAADPGQTTPDSQGVCERLNKHNLVYPAEVVGSNQGGVRAGVAMKKRQLSSTTLDKIFFTIFLVISVPFYVLVFAV